MTNDEVDGCLDSFGELDFAVCGSRGGRLSRGMTEIGETKPKQPAPKFSRWWWAGPLLVAAVVAGVWGWDAWKHHQFEKERTETPPHVVADLKLKLLWIPAGTFTMGTDKPWEWVNDVKKRYNDLKPAGWAEWEISDVTYETPATVVTLTKGFYLGETEVTQAQWKAIMGNNPSKFKGPIHPVEKLWWNDCLAFCKRLTERERTAGRIGSKQLFRPPTEAEWEYSCRAGSSGKWCFGNDEKQLGEFGWYEANWGNETHEVGRLRANAWGLYDMHGNVWEWCTDCYDTYPGGSVSDPTGAGTGSEGILRGGGAWFLGVSCGSATRDWFGPDNGNDYLGFRVVLSETP